MRAAGRTLGLICLGLCLTWLLACSNGRSGEADTGSGSGTGSTAASTGTSANTGGQAGGSSGGQATHALLAGAARRDITPPVGAPLGGYGAGPRRILDANTIPLNISAALGWLTPQPTSYCTLFEPSVGKHDAICAKALVVEKAGERFAILSLDAVGVSKKLRDDIAQLVAPHGIAADHLMVAATHTHSGPGAIADKKFWQFAAMDLFNQQLYDDFVNGSAEAVIAAVNNLEPALAGYASEVEDTVQRNRRGLGIVDPELTVVQLERIDGSVVALLVNLAIHGICLDADNLHYSADLMGYCEREAEAQLGGDSVCLFLNGAEGDVSPNQYDWAGAESIGRTIAAHALRLGQQATLSARDDIEIAVI